MRLKASLLLLIEAYGAAASVPESAVSRMLFGSGNRVRVLRGGGMASCKIEDALQTLSDRWPEGAEWPSQVPRPAPVPLSPVDPSASHP